MQFNYKNNPVLKMLEDGKLNFYYSKYDPEIWSIKTVLDDIWAEFAPACKKEIYYMTNTFIKEMETKVLHWTTGNYNTLSDQKMTKLVEGSATFITKECIHCFHADPAKEKYYMLELLNINNKLTVRSLLYDDPEDKYNGFNKIAWTSIIDTPPAHRVARTIDTYAQILAAYFFIQNVSTRTKVLLPPKKKTRIPDGKNDYKNDTNHHIQVLDARWYTTIIQPEPFLVGTHERNQRYGPGFQSIKKITIEAFWKKGYTSNFKKSV